jgi:peptide/nickel transport system permease protein
LLVDLRFYILQRLFSLVIVLIGSSGLVFLIMRALPGDPASAMMGLDTTPEMVEAMRRQLGLDQPLGKQYWDWVVAALQGDFGRSLAMRREVADLVMSRFPITLLLSFLALIIAFLIAIPAGVLAAVRKGTWVDHVSRVVALTGVSMPSFWLGLLLILLFSTVLGWLPPGGYVSPLEDFRLGMAHIILPAFTLGTYYAATIARMLRSSMLDVLNRDYILVAESLGISRRVVIWRDAFRNGLIPTLTVSGFAFGYMLSGTILIEVIFNIPGLGRLLYDGISYRDYTLVQGVVLFNIAIFVVVNFIVDVLYAVLDPRIRQ